MLKEKTMKVLNNKVKEELKLLKSRGYTNSEIVNIPIIIKRNKKGDIIGYTSLDYYIIPTEYEEE